MAEKPRIYVACLASYNAGTLHGEWIDADQSADELREAVQAMLAKSPTEDAEEWAIHDHENFAGIELGEYTSLERVAEIASFLAEHGDGGAAAYRHYGDLDEAREAMTDRYQGDWSSLADWAEELLSDCGDLQSVPEALRPYIDFEKYARDLELSGDVFTAESDRGVFVFWAH